MAATLLPVIYRAAATGADDCNDADPDVWATCATCRDGDGDGAYAGCDAFTQRPRDCNDADILIGPHMMELPDDGRDNDCADGDLRAVDDDGVFVALTGDDAAAGTRAAPKRTVQAAAALAATGNRRVYVAAGAYGAGVSLPSAAVSIFGGYRDLAWNVRDPAAYPTSLGGITMSAAQRIAIDGLTSLGMGLQATAAVVSRCTLASSGSISGSDNMDLAVVASTVAVAVSVGSRSRLLVAGTRIAGGASSAVRAGNDNHVTVVGTTIDLSAAQSGDRHGVLVDERNVVRIDRSTIRVVGAHTTYGVRLLGLDNVLVMRGTAITTGASYQAYGLRLITGQALVVGSVFRDAPASIYHGVDATGYDSYLSAARVELLQSVIHADEATRAVGLRVAYSSEASAINNVIWLEALGSAVELAGTAFSVELYHNDLVAPPGRCLLETFRVDGFCALDVDDVNACQARGLCAGVGGNLSAPPRFVDPVAGDYHLQASSPLIDRGYDLVAGDGLAGLDRAGGPLGAVSLYSAGAGAVDIDGQLRTPARRWDIGVDER